MIYPEGSVVVVDRLYGGLDLVEQLSNSKVYMVTKCKSNRPTWLFKNYLHKVLKDKIGQYAACRGNFENDVPFVALSIISKIKGKKLIIDNYISTLHDNAIDIKEVLTEEEEKDGTTNSVTKAIFNNDSIVNYYNIHSGHIDEINRVLMDSLPICHINRWKMKLLLLFIYGMINNARQLFKMHLKQQGGLEGQKKSLSPINFRISVVHYWCPLPVSDKHLLNLRTGSRFRCVTCKKQGKNRRTNSWCVSCQVAFCQTCFKNPDIHFIFSLSVDGMKLKSRFKFKDYIDESTNQQVPQPKLLPNIRQQTSNLNLVTTNPDNHNKIQLGRKKRNRFRDCLKNK